MLRFKGYCAEHNIKQREIADLLEISPENANAKINGRQQFTLAQVRKLCETYGISADYYFLPESCDNATNEAEEEQR